MRTRITQFCCRKRNKAKVCMPSYCCNHAVFVPVAVFKTWMAGSIRIISFVLPSRPQTSIWFIYDRQVWLGVQKTPCKRQVQVPYHMEIIILMAWVSEMVSSSVMIRPTFRNVRHFQAWICTGYPSCKGYPCSPANLDHGCNFLFAFVFLFVLTLSVPFNWTRLMVRTFTRLVLKIQNFNYCCMP